MNRTTDLERKRLLDAVMARVENEPVPTAGEAFLAAVRRRAPRQAGTALVTAWRLATLRTHPVPLRTRVRAAALALGVGGVLATSGAVALASVASMAQQVAVHLAGMPHVEPARPNVSGDPASDGPSARPLFIVPSRQPDSPEPPSARPTAPPVATPAPDRTARPTARPSQGGDGAGDGGGDSTPRPTASAGGHDGSGDGGTDSRETATPAPTSTPQASDSSTDGGSSATEGASSGD